MPFKKKKKAIPVEYLINEVKKAQSGTVANNHIDRVTQPGKIMLTNQKKDVHNDRAPVRKVENNASTVNSTKKFIEYNDVKRTNSSKKSNSKNGATDFRVKHHYDSDFKNRNQIKNKPITKANIRPLMSCNLHVRSTSDNSQNSVPGNYPRVSSGCQGFNTVKNQNLNSHPKSKGNFSNGCEMNLDRHLAQSYSVPNKSPAPATVASRSQDERPDCRPKSKEVTSSWEQNCPAKKSSEPAPGPSAPKNILNVVINHIKADKKFQANVKSLMAKGNITANKSLIRQGDEYESEDEEMDWETSDQIYMIEHIKSIRKNLDTATSLSSNFDLNGNNFFERIKQNVLIVLDTNIFISSLPFVRDLRDSYLPELGLPLILIPWVVLRELDHLKTVNSSQLAKSAIRAIRYINESFAINHPRVLGQSFADFCSLENSACGCSDDAILSTCINIKAVDDRRRVMLITNDRNLESKAMVCRIEAYSKQKFIEHLVNSTPYVGNRENDQNEAVVKYSLFPKLNGIMKIALEKVVESELKKAFGQRWLFLVARKPPWNLAGVFECFLKHWRSVFNFTFERSLECEIREVKNKFASEEYGRGEKFAVLIKISIELLESVRYQMSVKASGSPDNVKLVKHLSTAIQEMQLLRKEEKMLTQQSVDVQMSASSAPIETEDVPIAEPLVSQNEHFLSHHLQLSPQNKEEVKAIFQMIWNQVQSFCMRVNEVVSNLGNADLEMVNQIKFQFPQVIQKLQELIESIERIVCMEPQEIVQSSQLITDFANLLISLNVIQTDSVNVETLLKNIQFFFCDEEGRGILRVLINDLQQFGTQIVHGMNLLGLI